MSKVWPTVLIGDVVRQERDPVGSYDGDGLPVMGVTNTHGVTQTGIEASDDLAKYLRLRPGSFVFNPYRINVGSIGLHSGRKDGICSPAYVVFSPTDHIDMHFLHFFLKSAHGNQLINFHGNRGSVRSALRFDDLAKIEIPLPPLPEQKQIVRRIQELASQINEARALRQKAFEEGKVLVANQIKELFEKGPVLGWEVAHLNDFVADDCYGSSEKTHDDVAGTPVLRMGNIQNGRLHFSNLKYLHIAEKDREKLILKRGDILVNRTNSAELVGKCAVFDEEGEFSFASYLIRLRLDMGKANPHLVASYINSPAGRAYMFKERKQMTGQANVNATKLKALPISLPTLTEQNRIVAELDAFQAEVDALKRLQSETSAELDALLPSILDQAFKGEL
jgi:type I restriction enzyme S subunit